MAAYTKSSRMNTDGIQIHLTLGFLLRFIMIIYGEHHDRTNVLKYTDTDYYVMTDAAQEVANGNSPFQRHTYRYTPFLAWILLPNINCHFLFGKLFFSFLDCIATKLIYYILLLGGHSRLLSLRCSFLWLYNPLVIAISTRGSAESIMAVLVLLMIYLQKFRLPVLTGFMLGLAVHFKLYPIIYALPIYLSFSRDVDLKSIWKRLSLNMIKFKLIVGFLAGFVIPTASGYLLYEQEYLEEGFLYHFTRVDTRHNFSTYFYLLYLSIDYEIPGLWVATFGPQLILLLFISFKFGQRLDINFALFAETVVFVAFNKVVTSQYFIWYLLILPLIVPQLSLSIRKGIILTLLWIVAQTSWLIPAYLLEFHSVNAFVPIWLESIAFFCCNVGILISLISSYTPVELHHHHSTRKNR